MKFGRWMWLCVALALPSTARAGALPVSVRSFELANGLRVLMAPDSQATTVDVAVWYPAGTRYESPGLAGITHLFDGLMFGGSQHYPPGDHRRLLQSEGAVVNTFTTPDFSCFYQNLPPQALDLAIKLEADRMGYLALTPRSLAAARNGLRQQRAGSAENSPLGRGLHKLFATAFAGHPYRWPVSGLEADLDRITLQDCSTYYRNRYGPNGALLTLVGRMDPGAAEAAVRNAFGSLPSRGVKTTPPPLATQIEGGRGSGSAELQMPLVLAGWRTPPDDDSDLPALDLLGRVITRGTSSRLNRDLAGTGGVALLTRGDFDRRAGGGLLYALMVARPEADSTEIEQRLASAVEALADEPVSAAELEAARRQAEAEVFSSWQTTRGIAQSLGNAQMLDGDWRVAERRLERLRDLTPEDLRRAADRSLVPTHRTIIWLRPGAAPPTAGKPASPPGSILQRALSKKKGGR